jgi:lipopolysaccharide transport system ATP-binding protein
MYVRLAFAVAAHLEPEILLVDEVLAVGDAAFQKKCLGKMGDVAKEGRTVLFVSHNMAAVGRLCTNAFWLDQGQVAHSGTAQSVIRAYLASSESQEGYVEWADVTRAPGDEFMRALSVSILDMQGTRTTELHQDLPFVIRIEYRVLKPMMNANVGFELRADEGTVVFSSFDADSPEWSGRGRSEGVYVAQCIVPAHLLNEGAYYLTLYAGIPHIRVCVRAEDILRLDIKPPLSGKGPTARMGARRAGVISPELEWHISAPERVLEAHIALQ